MAQMREGSEANQRLILRVPPNPYLSVYSVYSVVTQ
jgi:hypothetical protein